MNSITPRGICEGNGGHLARTCFLIVQVLMNRGWLVGLIGDGVNDYAYAQEGERWYRCGLLRRDVAASCFQRRHLQWAFIETGKWTRKLWFIMVRSMDGVM